VGEGWWGWEYEGMEGDRKVHSSGRLGNQDWSDKTSRVFPRCVSGEGG